MQLVDPQTLLLGHSSMSPNCSAVDFDHSSATGDNRRVAGTDPLTVLPSHSSMTNGLPVLHSLSSSLCLLQSSNLLVQLDLIVSGFLQLLLSLHSKDGSKCKGCR